MEEQEKQGVTVSQYIKLIPRQPKRRPALALTGVPGLILLIASILSDPESVELILLRLVNAVSAIVVLYYAYSEYMKPGSIGWITQNAIRVLTGLLILAQAAADYKIVPDLQFVHLLFITGGAIIFKEVMFRDEKNIPGFELQEHKLVIRAGDVKRPAEVHLNDIKSISLSNGSILKLLFSQSEMEVNLQEYENAGEAVASLKSLLFTEESF